MKESEVLKILYQVMNALVWMNTGCTKPVIHRDIKPDNIMYNTNANPPHYVVADYGISKIFGVNNKTFTGCGTEKYQAPEIWYNSRKSSYAQMSYNESIDTFSVGIMLYELLFLDLPWD